MSERRWIKKNIDLESFYKDIQDLFNKRGSLKETIAVGPIPDIVFLNMLFSKSQEKVNEYIGVETETRCSSQYPTVYSSSHFEPVLWMLGLILLSWCVINLKKKTEGHCQNPNHILIDGHPNCHVGSEFHKGFFDAITKTLKQLTF